MYDRVELCKYLNIAVDQLPLLAILAGNDMVDFETLKVSKFFEIYVPMLAIFFDQNFFIGVSKKFLIF